jgi:hypothetical protein
VPLAFRLERHEDRRLDGVGILLFVHQHVVEEAAHLACKLGHLHQFRPVEEDRHSRGHAGFASPRHRPRTGGEDRPRRRSTRENASRAGGRGHEVVRFRQKSLSQMAGSAVSTS